FFSSRRRHTSCYRDWSSDVCSSDLPVEKQRVSQRDACQSRRVAGVQAGGRLILLDRAAHRARCALRELVVPAQKVVVGTRVGGGAGRERGLLGGGVGAAERGRRSARR